MLFNAIGLSWREKGIKMKLTDMSDKLNSLSTEIKRILSVSGYEDYSDLSCVDYDSSSSEDLLLMDE